jgi:hypothetical protein
LGQVLEIKSKENQSVVDAAMRVLHGARQGLITSLIYVAAGPFGDAQMGISGEFLADLPYAASAAKVAFGTLLTVETPPDQLTELDIDESTIFDWAFTSRRMRYDS